MRPTKTATFSPRDTESLRPELRSCIGITVDWRWAGKSDDDEPYPGQDRWNTNDERFQGYWVPDEDLST